MSEEKPEASLSKQQKAILVEVCERERMGRDTPWQGGYYWWHGSATRSAQASMSRALRRLEARGLVRRLNHMSGSPERTTHVAPTAEGRAIAERLTK